MYKINDVVVYRRDVCRVVGKEKSGFTGEKCYVLVPFHDTDGSTRMQVPVSNKAGHLRDLISKEDVYELIQESPTIEMLENKPANMKSQYANLLKTDSIRDLISIIKTSYERNRVRAEQHKKAAAVDEEYLQKAEKYLFDEIAVVMNMSYEEAKDFFIEEMAKVTQ